MFSDHGDYIGGGVPQSFTDSNGTISIGSDDPSVLNIAVSGGTNGTSFSLSFAAPVGVPLVRGFYDKAQRTSFRSAGRPGIDIGGEGRGCNETAGRVDVLDYKSQRSGPGTSLWLTYEQHCEGGPPALFGEVRYPAPNNGVRTSTTRVWFPDTYPKGGNSTVPVRLQMGGSPGAVSTVAGSGSSFSIRTHVCSGQQLQPTQVCVVYITFSPKVVGPHFGTV